MNARFTLPFLISLFISASLMAQLHYKWSQSIGSKNSDFIGKLLADREGNLYQLGNFRDTADLDPGPGTDIIYAKTRPVIAVIKSDPEGNFQWSGRFSSIGEFGGQLLAIEDDYIWLTFRFTDSLIYELNGTRLLDHYSPRRETAYLKLSLEGELLEVSYWDRSYFTFIDDILTLNNGHTMIAGVFTDTLFLPGTAPLVSVGEDDIFIVLVNQVNEIVWAKSFGSVSYDDMSHLIAVDDDHIYFTVGHEDTLLLTTVTGDKLFPATGNAQSVVGAINAQGEIIKAFGWTATDETEINDFIVDKDENIYVGGYYAGTINLASPSQAPALYTSVNADDGYVAKYNAAGDLQWVNTYIGYDYSYVINLELERDTDLYVAGGMSGRTDLDPGPDSLIALAETDANIFLAKMTTEGSQTWAYHWSGGDLTNLVISDARSEVILGGFFSDTLDCDHTENEAILVPHGGSDIFRIVFDEDNVISAVSQPTEVYNALIYPNPAFNFIRVESEDEIQFISVQSVNGQPLYHMSGQSNYKVEIELHDLTPGMYTVTLHGKESVITKAFVKL